MSKLCALCEKNETEILIENVDIPYLYEGETKYFFVDIPIEYCSDCNFSYYGIEAETIIDNKAKEIMFRSLMVKQQPYTL